MADHGYALRHKIERKPPKKRKRNSNRDKTRVYIGVAFPRWRQLMREQNLKTDAEFATFLLDSYIQTKSKTQPEKRALESRSSTETCESMDFENHCPSSPSEAEQKASAFLQSSEDESESGKKATTCPTLNRQDVWKTTNSENGDTEIEDNKEEQFTASLSIGDGHYMVDLGSPSEFIIDEDCILQLFKSCRKCMRLCTVRKEVKGLKLVVQQTCAFCQSCYKWTNLPDDDKSDIQIQGQDEAHEQRNSAMSANSNTS